MITLCAVQCGHEDWVSIEDFASVQESWLRGFLELPNGIPSHDTLSDVVDRILAQAQNPGVYDEILRGCAVASSRPRVKDCHENQTCMGLVEAGLGVTFVMTQLEGTADANLRIIDLEAPAPVLSIAVTWHRDDPSPLLDTSRGLAVGDPVSTI